MYMFMNICFHPSIHPSHFLYAFIHWWTLSCFHISAIVNNAATWKCRYPVSIFFGYIPRCGIAWSCRSSIFNFWGNSLLFNTVAASIYIPTNSVHLYHSFLHILSNTCYLVFLMIAILTGMRWYFIMVLICNFSD